MKSLNISFVNFYKCAKIGESGYKNRAVLIKNIPGLYVKLQMALYAKKIIRFISAVIISASCSPSKKIPDPAAIVKRPITLPPKQDAPVSVITKSADDIFFEGMFRNDPATFEKIFRNKTDLNVQIIYTEIAKRPGGKQEFTNHYFNKGGSGYFYPASAIKLPLAILALQKLNTLKDKGIFRNTTMITGSAYSGQTEVYNDPNTPDGKPSLEQYIKRALLVNENDACNRLYEFLGQVYINTELKKHGYENAEILHRLGPDLTEDENRHTNPISFYDNNNVLIYKQPAQNNLKTYSKRKDFSGKSYLNNGKLIQKPMNMSEKNSISLESLHRMLISVYYPSGRPDISPFSITEDDRSFLLKLMQQDPGESAYPYYAGEAYNGYTKYMYFGGEKYKGKKLQSFNTSGTAYGQMTDAAIIKDPEKNIEFIISATIYCNSDGILNDDKYDYDKTGMPFFKSLGKAAYDYELKKTGRK